VHRVDSTHPCSTLDVGIEHANKKAAGQRRLAAPSLLRVYGASLPVGGPVNVWQFEQPNPEPQTSEGHIKDFLSYNRGKATRRCSHVTVWQSKG